MKRPSDFVNERNAYMFSSYFFVRGWLNTETLFRYSFQANAALLKDLNFSLFCFLLEDSVSSVHENLPFVLCWTLRRDTRMEFYEIECLVVDLIENAKFGDLCKYFHYEMCNVISKFYALCVCKGPFIVLQLCIFSSLIWIVSVIECKIVLFQTRISILGWIYSFEI